MTPKTFKLISRLREEGVKRGLEILIEVHSYYKKQVEIASKVDRVYDFALPPLLLHSLNTGHVEPVAHWTDIRPNNAVTVLDTHDGIGVIDIGSDQLDRSLKGLVPDEDVDNLVNTIHANTHGESQAATGAAASNLDLYQVNSTYYSALGCNDQHYIAARSSSCQAFHRSTMLARLPARTTWSCCARPTMAAISIVTIIPLLRLMRICSVRW